MIARMIAPCPHLGPNLFILGSLGFFVNALAQIWTLQVYTWNIVVNVASVICYLVGSVEFRIVSARSKEQRLEHGEVPQLVEKAV